MTMHRSFIISEEEKNRILNFHKNSTKNNYLILEQDAGSDTNPKSDDAVIASFPCLGKNHPKIKRKDDKPTQFVVNEDDSQNEYLIWVTKGEMFFYKGASSQPLKGFSCNSPLFDIVNKPETYSTIQCVVTADTSVALTDGSYLYEGNIVKPNGDTQNRQTNQKGKYSCSVNSKGESIPTFKGSEGQELQFSVDDDGRGIIYGDSNDDAIVYNPKDYAVGEPERVSAINDARTPTKEEIEKDKVKFDSFPCVLEQKSAKRIVPNQSFYGNYIKEVVYRIGKWIYFANGKKFKINDFKKGIVDTGVDYDCKDEFQENIYGIPKAPKTLVGKFLYNALHSINNIKDYEYLEKAKQLESNWSSVSAQIKQKEADEISLKQKNREELLKDKSKYSRVDITGDTVYKAGDIYNSETKTSSYDMKPWGSERYIIELDPNDPTNKKTVKRRITKTISDKNSDSSTTTTTTQKV